MEPKESNVPRVFVSGAINSSMGSGKLPFTKDFLSQTENGLTILSSSAYPYATSRIPNRGGYFLDENFSYQMSEPQDEDDDQVLTKEIVKQNIRQAESTTGMNLHQYKAAIANGQIKNYSRVHLNMWERMVRLLEEMEAVER